MTQHLSNLVKWDLAGDHRARRRMTQPMRADRLEPDPPARATYHPRHPTAP